MNDWRQYAECLGMNPNLFFPNKGENATAAKAVCARCPVRTECATEHLDEQYGVFGGLSENQRSALRRRNPLRTPQPINHGTIGGRLTHCRRGEAPCPACAAAHSAYVQRNKATRRLRLIVDNTGAA